MKTTQAVRAHMRKAHDGHLAEAVAAGVRKSPSRPCAILMKPRAAQAEDALDPWSLSTVDDTPRVYQEAVPLSHAQLASLLDMGHLMNAYPENIEIPARRMRLAAGDMLYVSGEASQDVFIIESGVLQRTRMALTPAPPSQPSHPEMVAYSGAGELIGLHLQKAARPESAFAITDAVVLALPIKAIERMPQGIGLLSDMLVRPVSATLIRDWQVAYKLRDLGANERTVAGLRHVATLCGAFSPHAPGAPRARMAPALNLSLSEDALTTWLGLDPAVLHRELDRLSSHGVIAMRGSQITRINLFSLRALSCSAAGTVL